MRLLYKISKRKILPALLLFTGIVIATTSIMSVIIFAGHEGSQKLYNKLTILQNSVYNFENTIEQTRTYLQFYLQTGRSNHLKSYNEKLIIIDSLTSNIKTNNVLDIKETEFIDAFIKSVLKKTELFKEVIKINELQDNTLAQKTLQSGYTDLALNDFESRAKDLKQVLIEKINIVKHQVELNKIAIIGLQILIIIFVISLITIWLYYLNKNLTEKKNIISLFSEAITKNFIKRNHNNFVDEYEMVKFLNQNLVKAKEFVAKLGEGVYDIELAGAEKKDSDDQGTTLMGELLNLRDKMKEIAETTQKNAIIEEERNWINRGIARFNEVLRQHTGNIELLTDDVTHEIVRFLQANLGGIFLMTEDENHEKYLNLVASYAYERKKYITKRLKPGEGLIGTCAIEKETIHLNEIPPDYIKITSGLGKANPKSLLIVPLKTENELIGVLEIASFNLFTRTQIEFVERIAESIASTISIAKINMRTTKLLSESQQKSEALAAQDEIMRQNMEELQATQEASLRKEMEMRGILEAIDHSMIKSETETSGTLITINQQYEKVMGYSEAELKGKNIKSIIPKAELENFLKIWQEACDGNHYKGIIKRKNKAGDDVWLLMSYTPVRDEEGNVSKILYLANDITELKKIELQSKERIDELTGQIEGFENRIKELYATTVSSETEIAEFSKLYQSLLIAEISPTGKFISVNNEFAGIIGENTEELAGRDFSGILTENESGQYQNLWHKVCSGNPFKKVLECKNKAGKIVWLQISFAAIKDSESTLKKIVMLGFNITENKLKEQELQLKLTDYQNKEREFHLAIEELKKGQEIVIRNEQEKFIREQQIVKLYEEEISRIIESWNLHLDSASTEKERLLKELDELRISITEIKEIKNRDVYQTEIKEDTFENELEELYIQWLNRVKSEKERKN